MYRWTKKGTWMRAKSLNTDKIWEAYDMLVDDYYQVKGSNSVEGTGSKQKLVSGII